MLIAMLALAGGLAQTPSPLPTLVERAQRLDAKQIEKVEKVLSAIRKMDSAALKREGAVGVPYTIGYSHRNEALTSAPFNIDSLEIFVDCVPSKPQKTGFDWVSVNWTCPQSVDLPWPSMRTSFKLKQLSITAVQSLPGSPSFRVGRNQ